jgi:hypothetical protein
MKQAMASGKNANPWDVDYDPEKASKSTKDTETLVDKAKSYSW